MPYKKIKERIADRIKARIRFARGTHRCWICNQRISGEYHYHFGSSEKYHTECLINAVYLMEYRKKKWLSNDP